jgi:hypothetical protein
MILMGMQHISTKELGGPILALGKRFSSFTVPEPNVGPSQPACYPMVPMGALQLGAEH